MLHVSTYNSLRLDMYLLIANDTETSASPAMLIVQLAISTVQILDLGCRRRCG